MNQKFIRICLVLFTLAVCTQSLFADKVDYGCKEKIDLALYDLGLFYSEKLDVGIDKDLVDLLKEETGCQFNITVRPRARIWSEIESGHLGMSTSGISNPERLKFAYFVDYMQAKNYVILNQSLTTIKNFNDFLDLGKPNFVGVVRSFKHGKVIDDFLAKIKEQGRLKEYATANDVADALVRNEIMMMFSLQVVFPMLLKEKNLLDKVVIQDWEKNNIGAALIFSRKLFTETQIKNWNLVVNKLLKKGSVKKIIKKHLPAKYVKSVQI